MELFTLGVGNYTESDVEAAASAWTGYNAEWNEGPVLSRQYALGRAPRRTRPDDLRPHPRLDRSRDHRRDPAGHLHGDAPTSGATAARRHRDQAVGVPRTPRPAGRRDRRCARHEQLRRHDGDIRELVRSILMRDEFYSTNAKQGLVRTPIEYLAAIVTRSDPRSVDRATRRPSGATWSTRSALVAGEPVSSSTTRPTCPVGDRTATGSAPERCPRAFAAGSPSPGACSNPVSTSPRVNPATSPSARARRRPPSTTWPPTRVSRRSSR